MDRSAVNKGLLRLGCKGIGDFRLVSKSLSKSFGQLICKSQSEHILRNIMFDGLRAGYHFDHVVAKDTSSKTETDGFATRSSGSTTKTVPRLPVIITHPTQIEELRQYEERELRLEKEINELKAALKKEISRGQARDLGTEETQKHNERFEDLWQEALFEIERLKQDLEEAYLANEEIERLYDGLCLANQRMWTSPQKSHWELLHTSKLIITTEESLGTVEWLTNDYRVVVHKVTSSVCGDKEKNVFWIVSQDIDDEEPLKVTWNALNGMERVKCVWG
eukprot:344365_1